MGKQESSQKADKKHKPRPTINNYNPYNSLNLNQYHQIEHRRPESANLHKKKRDLERLIQYRAKKGDQIQPEKEQQLNTINTNLQERKKTFEKSKRKEFFLSGKYKQIMNIQRRKILNKLHEIRSSNASDKNQVAEWEKKLNYIKFYPKNLKYVSLFPTSQLNEKAAAFQQKIMTDIEEDQRKQTEKLNAFKPDNEKKKVKVSKEDDFFLVEEQQG